MTNHIHMVAVPGFESSLGDSIGRTHQMYSDYFNAKYARKGHLWQSRYYSCPMDMEHTLNALAYVELNPVRACMVSNAWDYLWSSAAAHVGRRPDRLLDLSRWFREFTAGEWIENLYGFKGRTEVAEQVGRYTHKGRPLGRDKSFLDKIAEHGRRGSGAR
jgi:putative transposase